MSIHYTLLGGPPWGMRITHDHELRPVIAKILPGGRAWAEGIRAGDQIESVNNETVNSCGQAHALIQAAQGQLRLKILRNPDLSSPMSNSESTCNSALNSPLIEQRTPLTSSPLLFVAPRTNPFFPRHRQIRLDLEGTKGSTENKRRFFEQIESVHRSPATDRLLQRKIQMGVHQGVPSESTAGYDSVSGDFACGRSISDSGRISPSLNSVEEETEAKTILEDISYHAVPSSSNFSLLSRSIVNGTNSMENDQMRPGTSQWTLRAESHNEEPAEGNVEVPGHRSVAALRKEITSKLEMKSPSSPTQSKITPSLSNQKEGKNIPSWNSNFVQVYERNGFDDQKPYLGRVLDGPVAAHKFFQGVPPPSYNLCHSPVSSTCSESKPPLPPSVPPKPASKTTRPIRLPQSTSTLDAEENATNELRPQSEEPTSPVKTQINKIPNIAKPCESVSANMKQEDIVNGTVFDDGASITSSGISNFGDTSLTTKSSRHEHNGFSNPTPSETSLRGSSNEDQKGSLFERSPSIHSMDLESSELLLKSRSPAPFTLYSSSSSNHYGTIRRSYNPVTPRLNLTDMNSSSEAISTPANVSYSFSNCTNDSGYEGASLLSPDGPAPFTDIRDNASTVSSVAAPSTDDSRFETFTIDPHPESHENTMSSSTLDFENPAPSTPCAQSDDPIHRRQFPSVSEPEISLWYRNMFKKMHKVSPQTDPSVPRYQGRDVSPTSTISRPLTPSSFVSRPPSRYECEITPRRAKSVGRVIEPITSKDTTIPSSKLFAVERSRTPHFHLPSYKFRHEDTRAILSYGCFRCNQKNSNSDGRPCGVPCMKCGLPRKDFSWDEIEYMYKTIGENIVEQESKKEKIQSKIALRCITDKLDATAEELEQFIQRLDNCWKRSSNPSLLTEKKVKEDFPSSLAEEIAELKRISKEELMFRQKAERLTEELERQKQRRHGYIPSVSPALQKNFDRFEGLFNDFGLKETTPPKTTGVRTATAIYKFTATSPRELPLNKGDVVRINRDVDANWLEGERNGRSGIFPASYVQIESDFVKSRNKMRAVYPFTARNTNEMSLKMGEIVSYRRDIDSNWIEGANHLGEIGIFPKSYVQLVDETQQPVLTTPDRPKTPKFEITATNDIDYEGDFSRGLQRSFVEPTTRRSEITTYSSRSNGPSRNHAPKIQEWQEKHSSEGFFGPANIVPRGSETYRAIYPYTPCKEDEIGLRVDDIVFVVEKCDDGWYIGTLLRTGQFGTFPGNYVQRH